MRSWDLCTFLYLLPFTLADVEFVAPAAGADVAVGTILVQWKDSGKQPPITDLTQYTLSLMVGGNKADNMLQLAPFESNGDFSSGSQVSGTIPAGIASSVTNGFFFQIKSAASQGGEVINYSSRFSITGLTGSTPSQYVDAVNALHGSTAGPPLLRNVTGLPTESGTANSSATKTTKSTITSSSKSTSAASTPTKMTSSSTPATTTSINVLSPNKSKLSTGAVAGIAIAGTLVVTGMAAGVIFLCIRNRKLNKRRGQGPFFQDYKAELSGVELSQAAMAQRKPPVEIAEGARPSELDDMNVRVELEGDSVHGEVQGSSVISPIVGGDTPTRTHGSSPLVSPIINND